MCGLFGWFGCEPGDPVTFIESASKVLAHRGPDDRGAVHGVRWGAGFCRLSILDLSIAGHQPMSARGGRFHLVFNGEIYNYRELRAALEAHGARFGGTSDTEVLLELLIREGAAALSRLNGMFALAFVDVARRTFVLARDRLGVKPLYYRFLDGAMVFASELKALRVWRDAPWSVAPAAVADYLASGCLHGETAVIDGCSRLLPGHVLEGCIDEPHRAHLSRYWSLEPRDVAGRGDALVDELEWLLEDAVRLRLRSDVPTGVFLSGGLDSGIVAALAGKGEPRPLALTVGFDAEGYDETALAGATARRVGLEHHVVRQHAGSLVDVDRLAWYFDEPFGDPSALPMFALAEAAAPYATVFLTGDGGDEALGGYRRYVEARRRRWLASVPGWAARPVGAAAHALPATSALRFRLSKALLPAAGFAAAFDEVPGDPALALVAGPALAPHLAVPEEQLLRRWAAAPGRDLTARQRWLDYDRYLPDDILVKADRASMAHSIELRSPFLDYRLVEWAIGIPTGELLTTAAGKLPLRRLARRYLPSEVLGADKHGFGVPVDAWFRQPVGRRLVRERLLDPGMQRFGFWDPAGVEQLAARHATGRGRQFGLLLWRLLMLDAWLRQHATGTPVLDGPPRARADAR